MNNKTETEVRFIRIRKDDRDERCRQRLNEALGMDEESIEVIMNLRSQVTALQERLRELESMMETYQSGYNSRLIQYQQVFFEADWEDS
jgi:predicted nuclease with TOPRIM domain